MSSRITPNQAEWIFNRAREFTKRWAENPPSSERDWQELMEQAHDLMKRGRNHPLLMGIMVQVLGCIDQNKTQQTENGASKVEPRKEGGKRNGV